MAHRRKRKMFLYIRLYLWREDNMKRESMLVLTALLLFTSAVQLRAQSIPDVTLEDMKGVKVSAKTICLDGKTWREAFEEAPSAQKTDAPASSSKRQYNRSIVVENFSNGKM